MWNFSYAFYYFYYIWKYQRLKRIAVAPANQSPGKPSVAPGHYQSPRAQEEAGNPFKTTVQPQQVPADKTPVKKQAPGDQSPVKQPAPADQAPVMQQAPADQTPVTQQAHRKPSTKTKRKAPPVPPKPFPLL